MAEQTVVRREGRKEGGRESQPARGTTTFPSNDSFGHALFSCYFLSLSITYFRYHSCVYRVGR